MITADNIGEIDPATIRVTGSWVLILRAVAPEKVGRFYVPEEHRAESREGVVVRIGPEPHEEAKQVRAGDRVWVHNNAFIEARFMWRGEHYAVVKSEDLVAVGVA